MNSLRQLAVRTAVLVFVSLSTLPARSEVVMLKDVERRVLSGEGTRPARARVAQGDAEIDVVRSARRPVVTLSSEFVAAPGGQLVEVEGADGQRFLVQGSRPLGEPGAFTTVPRYGGLLSMQTNLLDFGRTSSRIRAAEDRARASRADEQAQTAELLRAAREAYLGWVVAAARLAHTERHERDAHARTESLRGLVAEGSRPPAEMSTAEEDELAVRLEVAEAHRSVERARLTLDHLVGGAWSKSATPDLGLLEQAPANNALPGAVPPAAAVLEHQAAASAAMADSAARDHAPVVSASAEAGVRGQSSSVFPAYRVSVLVTVPLWDGGTGSAQARAARAQADALRAEATAARKAHEDELALARLDATSAQEKLRIAARLQQIAQGDLDQANERYHLGATDLRAILDARERVSRAEMQELAAKAERASAWLRTQP